MIGGDPITGAILKKSNMSKLIATDDGRVSFLQSEYRGHFIYAQDYKRKGIRIITDTWKDGQDFIYADEDTANKVSHEITRKVSGGVNPPVMGANPKDLPPRTETNDRHSITVVLYYVRQYNGKKVFDAVIAGYDYDEKQWNCESGALNVAANEIIKWIPLAYFNTTELEAMPLHQNLT